MSKKIHIISCVALLLIVVIAFLFLHHRENHSPVATIFITNQLVSSPQYNTNGLLRQDETVALDVVRQIQEAGRDRNIKAIAFIIDSQGGDPESAEEITIAMKATKKPTVALIRSEGDSPAYWVASASDRIFALPISMLGDIGITSSYVDNSIQDEANGLTFHQLSIGKYKDMGNTDKPLTADEQALMMTQMQAEANVFINAVAENRHLSLEKVQALANGASMSGTDALKNGLIDQIGSFADVNSYLSSLIKTKVNLSI